MRGPAAKRGNQRSNHDPLGERDRRRLRHQRVLVTVAMVLVGTALGVVGSNLYVSALAKENALDTYELVQAQMGDALSTEGSAAAGASVVVDGKTYLGTLQVPSLDLLLPVATEWRDEDGWSRLGACRYSGSIADGDLVVAVYDAQVTDGLTAAADGDAVRLTDVNGVVHEYVVGTVETVDDNDIASVREASDDWELTLLGPTFSGTKRVVLRCSEI